MTEFPNPVDRASSPEKAVGEASDQPVLLLDKNENPFEMPRVIKDEVLRRLASARWARFPEEIPERLIEKLARFNDWHPEGILVGNGSSELLQLVLEKTVDRTTRILAPEPTLGPFARLAQRYRASMVSVPMTESLQFNVPKLCSRAVAMKTELVYINSPHNPTGCLLAESDLVMLLKTSSGIVIVDEAYHDFVRQTVAHLLGQYSQLVLLRTFSIALGMAGLRVGYLMGAPEFVRALRRAIPPFHLNIFSAAAAEAVIDHYEAFGALVEKIVSERDRLYRELGNLRGVDPVPSHANFLLVRTEWPGQRLCQWLQEREVLVRDLSAHPLLANSVRISIGTPGENERLLAAFKEIFSP